MKKIKLGLMLSAFLFSSTGIALQSDYDQPVNITSERLHAKLKSNTVVYEHNVLLVQGTLKITGDSLTVIRGEQPNQEIMIAEGKTATFFQMQDDGKPLDAEANHIHYDVAKAKITLTGNAQVKQLNSQINGAKITYFLDTEELIVETDKDSEGRVKTVFLPAELEKSKEDPSSN